MKSKPTFSKTQYIKGLQCPLALWFYRNRKDLKPQVDFATQIRFDGGLEVGALAEKYFGHGTKVIENYWDVDKAVQSTKQLIAEGNVQFESPSQSQGRSDAGGIRQKPYGKERNREGSATQRTCPTTCLEKGERHNINPQSQTPLKFDPLCPILAGDIQ